MGQDDLQSLSDKATFTRQAKRQREADVSIGDERTTAGAAAAGNDTVIDGIEVVDLAARYRLEGSLGHGGMGAVQLATDTRLDRKVAIKRILGEAARSPAAVARFVTEAKAIAALNHPNIVQIYDYGRATDGPFLIMEYVDGGSLADLCRAGPVPVERAVELICQVCEGLGVAHDRGIIHRDIKPANILLNGSGVPKLTDFGLAKAKANDHGMTMTGAVMGTPDFMPPEQRRDASLVDHRSDLWSLAATFYQLVTGRSPNVIRLDDLPGSLQPPLARALEDEKAARYQSARDFSVALRSIGGGVRAVQEDVGGDLTEGRCHACGTIHSDLARKFCRKCGSPLWVPCLQCEEVIPVWDVSCGECGANQRRLLAAARSALGRDREEAERLRVASSFPAAIDLARRVAAVGHPLLADLAAWGEGFAAEAADEYASQRDSAMGLYAEAQEHVAAFDYPAAIESLQSIPESMRDAAAADLLADCVSWRDESEALIEQIRGCVATATLDGLLAAVIRAVELRGDLAEFMELRQQLLARRTRRLSQAKEALARGDLVQATTLLADTCPEDFDPDDALFVHEAKAIGPVAATVAEALQKERMGEYAAAIDLLEAIPQPGRTLSVPGADETVGAILDRLRRGLRRSAERLERTARHRNLRLQLAAKRKEAEALTRDALDACAQEGFVADETRCLIETTAGPIFTSIARSWSPGRALWFAKMIQAAAFDAAAVLRGSLSGRGGGACFRIAATDVEETFVRDVRSPVRNRPRIIAAHSVVLSVEPSAMSPDRHELVCSRSRRAWQHAIGWIDEAASGDALATLLDGHHASGVAAVVKMVHAAAPPECRDLVPQLDQGITLADQGRHEEAVEKFRCAIAQNPRSVEAWVRLGSGLKTLGRFDEGIEATTQAIAANPRRSILVYNLACYHSLAEHVTDAVGCLSRAIAMRPEWQQTAGKDSDFDFIRRPSSFGEASFARLVNDREPARALRAAQKRAFDLADRGRLEEAVAALRDLTARHPEIIDAWVRLGGVLRRSGRIAEAVEAMEEAVAIAPRHPRLLYNLACYQSLTGSATKALRALMRAFAEKKEYHTLAEQDKDLDRIREDARFQIVMRMHAET